ncbi:MAG: type II secretion system protein [Chthonomonadales bacterium]|nr:type II secretion system protein [Chthonomonadales bacterium]
MTLVEALVVVGILAALSALIVTALGRVRENARRAVCTSNLHQIHRALIWAQPSPAREELMPVGTIVEAVRRAQPRPGNR